MVYDISLNLKTFNAPCKNKGKIVPVQATQAYRESGIITNTHS
jgi:hypothetical protein